MTRGDRESTPHSALHRLALDRGGLLVLCIFMMYAWIAPVTVIDGDNAEFSTLGVTGGAAHPSGYPLYVLWLRATSWIPAASPAHAAALATAFLAALSAFALHAACRAWGARPLAATATIAIFAGGPVVMRLGTEAEVFALNGLVVATVLWLSAVRSSVRGIRRAALLGFVAGLGLANHLTCALVAPVGLLGVVRASREARDARVAYAAAALGLLAGLLPYAYLLVAPDTPMSWGAVRDFDELIAMITRRDYGGPTAFRVHGVDVSPWASVLALVQTIGRAWLWLPALLGIAVLCGGAMGRRATDARWAEPLRDSETRWAWSMLLASFLVAGPLLALRFNVPPTGLGLYVCQRFHILPATLLAIPIAVALSIVTARLHARDWLIALIVSTLGFVAVASFSLGYVGRVHSPAVELSARNLLGSLPRNAVVMHGQDELHATTAYMQWALGVRQDVSVLTSPMIGARFYRERATRAGLLPTRGYANPRAVADHILRSGRPLFVDRLQRDVIAAFPSHPYGILIRVLPRGTALPSVREVFAINKAVYARFTLDYPRPGLDDEFATEVHLRYSAIWNMIGHKLEEIGAHDDAEWARRLARELAPRP
jgi:hypothetical protein